MGEQSGFGHPWRRYEAHLIRTGSLPCAPGESDALDFRSRAWLPTGRSAAILDIGCGWGCRLLALHNLGFTQLVGVDLQRGVVEAGRARLPSNVTIVCAEASEFLRSVGEKYDRILLFHVLEHLDVVQGIELLALIRSRLKPQGRAVVEVPNMACLTAGNTFYSDLTHRTAYTEYSLAHALDEAGFSDIGVVCPVPRPRPGAWRPWRPVRGTTLAWWASRLLHRAVYFVLNTGPRPTCFCPALLMMASDPEH